MRLSSLAALLAAAVLVMLPGTAHGLAPAARGPATRPAPVAGPGFVPGIGPSVPWLPTGPGPEQPRPGTPSPDEPLPEYRFQGPGFDACSAPPLEAMSVWWTASPYGAVNIYSSGGQRGCKQDRLTPQWVAGVRAMGWELVPTHVGLQAPCAERADKPLRIDPGRADEQGEQEAGDAVAALQALGLGQGSPVYLDMEGYPTGDEVCSRAVVDFTAGWTRALHEAGYRSGFYSSMNSGVADIVAAAQDGRTPLPDALWYARWDGKASTTGQAGLPEDLWAGQRIHQYRGSANETYGGVTLNIDRDQIDGPVAGGS
ncbi:glycoside hydrolase domain-containing protein [Kitasatospora sp. NPDC059577]|uniref:glycoside hydrolase domain-containing protein n=1 Tax=Kitasatospora sp. NPDC059577 TaxID=3346873 RepID=UPI00369A921F